MLTGLNIGSGQRRFEDVPEVIKWWNIDCVTRPPDQIPDMVCDPQNERLPFNDESVNYCVLSQVYEHWGLGEGHGVVRECYRVLKPEGRMIVSVPDMKALAQRWLLGQIDDYIYFVNVYGAYQGEPGDRHKWGYSYQYLMEDLRKAAPWHWMARVSKCDIPGIDIAFDWWINVLEATK